MSAAPNSLAITTSHWFALQVRPRHELAVAVGLREKGIQSLVPILVERRRWSDRLKTVRTPLFAGYVFCHLERADRLSALQTAGVVRLVGFGGHACSLGETEVESLIALSAGDVKARPCNYLQTGQRVRLVDGPLAGLTGVLERSRTENRLIVSIELLQRSVAVEVGNACVQPMMLLTASVRPR